MLELASGQIVEHYRRGYPLYGGEFGLSWTSDGKRLLISPDLRRIVALDLGTGFLSSFYEPDDARLELYLSLA